MGNNFDFFGTYVVQNQQINRSHRTDTPFQTDIGRNCSWYRYFDITILIVGAFQHGYCNFLSKPIRYIGLLLGTNCGVTLFSMPYSISSAYCRTYLRMKIKICQCLNFLTFHIHWNCFKSLQVDRQLFGDSWPP